MLGMIAMGCGDACPSIPGRRYIDWELRDPRGVAIDEVRRIRDGIASRIEDLVLELDAPRMVR